MTKAKYLRLTLDIRFDKDGDVCVSYEGTNTDTHALGDFIVKASRRPKVRTTKLF